MNALLGIDVGGTFTDAVLVLGRSLHTAKTLSTQPQHEGVIEAARSVLNEAGISASSVTRFVHGMTVATNALLERRGARTVLVATDGFTDVPAIGRQERSELYTLYPQKTPPLIQASDTVGVVERVGPGGTEVPLTDGEVDRVVEEVGNLDPDAIAVCFLWSFLHPEHESRVRCALLSRFPDLVVAASSDVAPVFREYERTTTTIVDAYVTPAVRRYLNALAVECRSQGLRAPEIMQSSGGTVPLSDAAGHAAHLLLSGPAGGAVAARRLGETLGRRRILSFDMGGTSTDCAALDAGLPGGDAPSRASLMPTGTERKVAGMVVRVPMVDIHTVSAGGGSIAWVDAGGALKVGPESAGADPGPACYGRGGTHATVTDANVVLGRIAPAAALAGRLGLQVGEAHRAVARVAEQLGLSAQETAEGIVRVAVFNMAAALRKVTLERGLDPRDFVLVAFGGAGGLHACSLAEEVGMKSIVVSTHAGVLSALGLVASPRRVDRTATVLWEAKAITPSEWELAWKYLEDQVLTELDVPSSDQPPVLGLEVEARYRGQSHELVVRLAVAEAGAGPPAGPAEAVRAFHELHEERYGYREDGSEVEIVALRTSGAIRGEDIPSAPAPRLYLSQKSRLVIEGETSVCPVYRVEEAGGAEARFIRGPALVTAPNYSVLIAPGWTVQPGPGALLMNREGDLQG